jgi:hypothetical protein
MDTLRERLADLAQDAPKGGAPAAELWARGKRTHRLRAGALAATLLVVGAVGAGIGVRLADPDGNRIAPAKTADIRLPINYPAGEDLPDLGDAPGPLAAIWLVPGLGGGAPEAVGLVAETGTFGRLPIQVSRNYADSDSYVALSPDGRRIAYNTPREEMVVRDLVSGDSYSPAFGFAIRSSGSTAEPPWYTWVDATHLVGHHAAGAGGEGEGWVWQPGTKPKMVDLMDYLGTPYLGPYAGVFEHPWFLLEGEPRECLSLRDTGAGAPIPVLCDVVGVLGPEVALTHDGDGAVVALDADGVEDPVLRHVVATPGGPLRVTFATDLIQAALKTTSGPS